MALIRWQLWYLYEEERHIIKQTADKLSKARFPFALKCLQIVVQMKASKNVVFSPYSIHEGLMMLYFASRGYTEIKLQDILQLPVNVPKEVWMAAYRMERQKENRERCNGYYDENNCWIKSSNNFTNVALDLFDTNKSKKFHCFDIPNIMHGINKVLRDEMQGCFPQPVELNRLHKNMEFILSSVFCFKGDTFQPDLLTDVPNTHRWLEKPRTVLSLKLGMFVTELPVIIKTQSLFLLFPAVPSGIPNFWEIDENISGLVERLTTEEGTDQLLKVLDKEEASTEKLSAGSVIYPDFFELENELPMDQLLEILGIRKYLDHYTTFIPNFTFDDVRIGGAMHRAYIKVTSENVIAGAVNMFFTKNQGSFKPIGETNYSQCKNSFVSLIYDRPTRTILLIGVINKNFELPEVSKRSANRYFVEHK